MKIKDKLSSLWIVIMFSMVFADVFSFTLPGFFKELMEGTTPIKISQELLLAMAVLVEIPIAMIFLSRFLGYRVNRWANIIAAIISILFVIAGGSSYLHYIFFAIIEIFCLLLIIWYAWKWKGGEM